MIKKVEELKKFSTKHEIHIKLCLTLAKHSFKFLGTNDLGVVAGFCQECGHGIRYEQNYLDVQTGVEYTIGSNCMFKIYILSHWRDQVSEKDLENKNLQRAGKWLWVIHRDGYSNRIEEDLPQPVDYGADIKQLTDEDFKQLVDDLRNIVFRIRVKIKKEIAEKKRIVEEKRRQANQEEYNKKQAQNTQSWLESQGIDINKCNNWEKEFLNTMQEAQNKGWKLSDKQVNIYNRIKIEKCVQQDVVNNQNLASITIVNDVSKKADYSQLTDWEKDFMESIERQVDLGRTLTQKQLDIMQKIDDKLSNGKKTEEIVPIDVDEIVSNKINEVNENCGGYIGRKINSWFINNLAGIWSEGIVNFVKKETDSAILCNVFVKNGSEGIIVEEKWIPKSQLVDDNFSL